MKRWSYVFFVGLMSVTLGRGVIGCTSSGQANDGEELSFPYTPIPAVPEPVNDLGRLIAREQVKVVTPGGDEFNPGFSAVDQDNFEASGQLADIVDSVTKSRTFRAGVAAIQTLPEDARETILRAYAKPVYPTWAMNGHIGPDGTTNAGYAVELTIAGALTDAVKDALTAARESTPTATPTITVRTECPGGIVGDVGQPAGIHITERDPDRIGGYAQNVDGRTDRVVCYAFTDCAYVQPDTNAWETDICSTGEWSTATYPWARLGCMVVDPEVFPHPNKLCTARDSELCSLPGVKACDLYPPEQAIVFSGSEWTRKESSGFLVGPGPNLFDAQNVSIDDMGAVRLALAKRDGDWTSAEITRTDAGGLGTYECRVNSRLDDLDSKVVAACFIYESQAREIDFLECSPSLVPAPYNCQYVVQPYNIAGNIFHFTMPACATSTHRVVWEADRISFMSWCGHESFPPDPSAVVAQWEYVGASIPAAEGNERAHANIWLFNGDEPAGDGRQELTLHSFTTP